MNNLIVDHWDNKYWKYQFLKTVFDREPVSKIIIFACNEWDTLSIFDNSVIWDYFYYYIQKENIKVELITLIPISYQSENINISHWGEYYLIKTYMHVTRLKNLEKIKLKKTMATNLKYHFVCMNYRPHIHRCHMIDLLEQHNLIYNNAISWHNTGEFGDYPFKYFKPRTLTFNQDFDSFVTDSPNVFNVPIEYFESLAQLISESTDKHIAVTEKVSMALILGKPFLAHAGTGLHAYLVTLGFELYTEIFDYSFDLEPDSYKRLDMIIDNFKKLCEIPLDKLNEIEDQLRPKIEHNVNRAREISMTSDKFPEIIKYCKDDIHELTNIYNHIVGIQEP